MVDVVTYYILSGCLIIAILGLLYALYSFYMINKELEEYKKDDI